MNLDTSRAPRGQIAAAELVEAAAKIGDLVERHYIELKGPENLNSKANKQKVAKFILGAANRMPDRAAEAFEGCAVMVIGITDGGAVGLPPIEMVELNKVVEQHIGPDGPRWDIVRVPVKDSTNEVLVVVVEPPELGKPAWICRASGEGLVDGRIYIRGDGETREANSAEQDLLRERGAALPEAPVELAVSVVGEVTPVLIDTATTLDEYVAKTRSELLNALPKPEPEIVDGSQSSESPFSATLAEYAKASELAKLAAESVLSGGLLDTIPEKRSEAEYREQVDKWEAQLREAWPEAVLDFASYVSVANEIDVENKTTTFLHDVEVSLHIGGDVITVEPREMPDTVRQLSIDLPGPPRAWGPQKRDYFPNLNHDLGLAGIPFNPGNYPPSRSSWRNSGSVEVDVRVGDLRPKATFQTDDEESVLIVVGDSPEAFAGTWSATVRGYNQVFEGDLSVEVTEPLDLTELVRLYLGLAPLAEGKDTD